MKCKQKLKMNLSPWSSRTYTRQWRQNYRNGQTREANFKFWLLYTRGNSLGYPFVGGRPTEWVSTFFKGKITLPWLESNHDSSRPKSRHYLDWTLAVLHSSSRRDNKATKKSTRHGLYLRLWQSQLICLESVDVFLQPFPDNNNHTNVHCIDQM